MAKTSTRTVAVHLGVPVVTPTAMEIVERFDVKGMLRILQERAWEAGCSRRHDARKRFDLWLEEYRKFVLWDAAGLEIWPIVERPFQYRRSRRRSGGYFPRASSVSRLRRISSRRG